MKTLAYSLAAALLLAGCTDADFATFNQSFSQAKGAVATTANADLAAAAIATDVTTLALMDAIGKDKGGVVAVGAGHYGVRALTNDYALDPSTGTGRLKSSNGDKPLLDATFDYVVAPADGGARYTIKNLKGKALGYDLDLGGTFDSASDRVKAALTGTLTVAGAVTKLEELSFEAAYPVPNDVPRLGKLTMTNLLGKLEMDVSRQGGKAQAEGTLTTPAGTQHVTADEDGNFKFE